VLLAITARVRGSGEIDGRSAPLAFRVFPFDPMSPLSNGETRQLFDNPQFCRHSK
jgi:hypothetical protein